MTFDCVEGDFIEDMTPCAPKGKFGLSYPTGSASIARVVSRWQDYGGHLGGVTSNATTKTRIGFLGGWMGPGGFAQQWSITIDRLTGSGVLSIQKDGTPQPENFDVECAVARPKL